MPPLPDRIALIDRLGARRGERWLADRERTIELSDLTRASLLGRAARDFAGRNVLIAPDKQFDAALAVIALDGVAESILLAPPDLASAHRATIIADAQIDVVIADASDSWSPLGLSQIMKPFWPLRPKGEAPPTIVAQDTKWLMLTSGTTGRPKIVAHTLDGLTGAIAASPAMEGPLPIWATFYDIRRYGGLQILLRALMGGSLVLSELGESLVDYVERLVASHVSHISGTPSHWRKALMSDVIHKFKPDYVRLSGEIADQAVLDGLRKGFPQASIGHAYASTEAGVGFAVDDGQEGFPASLIDKPGTVEMKVVEGTLHMRSHRAALNYVGTAAPALLDQDGFIDTGDMVERRGDRYYFVGRRGGIINVGGLKVHPEEVESVLNLHPAVRMSRVKSRKSPIMGAVVVADVVLSDGYAADDSSGLKTEILAACRQKLPAHKVPAVISIVPALEVSDNGKLVRLV